MQNSSKYAKLNQEKQVLSHVITQVTTLHLTSDLTSDLTSQFLARCTEVLQSPLCPLYRLPDRPGQADPRPLLPLYPSLFIFTPSDVATVLVGVVPRVLLSIVYFFYHLGFFVVLYNIMDVSLENGER